MVDVLLGARRRPAAPAPPKSSFPKGLERRTNAAVVHRTPGRSRAAGAVVDRECLSVPGVVVPRFVELRRSLDHVPRSPDVDALVRKVDALDEPCWQHDLLAEDPGAGVDEEVADADLLARRVDLPDLAVERFDAIADEVDLGPSGIVVAPDR